MRTWAGALTLLTLIAFSFLVAGAIASSVGESAGSPSPGPALAATTPAPSSQGALDRPAQPVETPTALAHRLRVLQDFSCSECHGPQRGWPAPADADHAAVSEGECRNCHRPASEPPPIALHATTDQDPVGEACGLCHGNVEPPTFSVDTNAPLCTSCHSSAGRALPISHADRSQSSATCTICHETNALAVPAVPHKLDGWENCTFCHGPQRLTPLEGAHKPAAENQCMLCHTTVQQPPNMNTTMHELSKEQDGCVSCHAEGRLAPLPSSHADRADALCVLCHTTAQEKPPTAPHTLAEQSACNSCHAPQDIGGLPASHTARTDQMCVSCHKIDPAPAIPHPLENRTACQDCHLPSSRDSPLIP